MKRTLLAVTLFGLLSVNTTRASDEYPWDFDFNIGGTIPENPKLLNGVGDLSLNAGFTMSMGLTYHVTPWLRVGPEFTFNYNTVDEIGDYEPFETVDLIQMPMMINAIFEPTLDSMVRPYAGLGAGGNLSVFSSYVYYWDYWYYYYYEGESDSDFVFSWQAFAGVKWQLNEKAALGVQYRYVWADRQEWDYTHFTPWGAVDYPLKVDSYGTHCISLYFQTSF